MIVIFFSHIHITFRNNLNELGWFLSWLCEARSSSCFVLSTLSISLQLIVFIWIGSCGFLLPHSTVVLVHLWRFSASSLMILFAPTVRPCMHKSTFPQGRSRVSLHSSWCVANQIHFQYTAYYLSRRCMVSTFRVMSSRTRMWSTATLSTLQIKGWARIWKCSCCWTWSW